MPTTARSFGSEASGVRTTKAMNNQQTNKNNTNIHTILFNMKKLAMSVSSLLLGILAVSFTACSGDKTTSTAPAAQAVTATDGATPSINIRYIDMDSINANYQGAKDLQDFQIRKIQSLENARMTRGQEIQKFANQVQQKVNSNGYLSEASYNADMQKLQKMQQDAETALNNMNRQIETEVAQETQKVNDAMEQFIKEYNASKGYDMILFRHSGAYFNPALDITAEVVAGLNEKYTPSATVK